MKHFIIIFAVLIGFQSLAQDTLKSTTLERVLVTGVRADRKTPVTQKTVGDTSLQDGYQGQEVPMLLGSLPSIFSNSDGGHAFGYSYFSLRGASQSRINMTLNGVPLNEPEDHGVYTSNYPSFINAIQSLQIQRGVGTSSNGAASFIGSINFQSKNGFRRGTEIQFGLGSFNTQRFNISTSTGLSKKNFALFANVGGIKTDGFRNNSGSIGGSVFVSGGYFGDKRVTKLVFFSGQSENEMAWEGSDENVLKINYRDNPRGVDNKDFFRQTHVQLHNVNFLNKRSKLVNILFYNHLNGRYDVYNKKDLPVFNYYASEKQYSNWVGYVGQYDYKTSDINISTGVSLNTYTRYHNGVEYFDTTNAYPYKNHGTKNEISGFVKINLGDDDVREYVDIQGRYVEFNYRGDVPMPKQSWFFFNPKVGVKVFHSKNFDSYYTIGLSHREPTRTVLFNGGFYLTNLNAIKAEQVIDIELGVNYRDSKLELQSNVFCMLFENEIIPAGPPGSNSLPTMINVDKSYRVGFEADAAYHFSGSFSYNGNLTISDSRFGELNKRQLFSPSVILNQGVNYSIGNYSFNLNHSYFSKSYIDISNENTVDGYFVLNTNLTYTKGMYKLSVQVNNLTGQKYYCNGYVVNGVRYLFPNALTNVYATLIVKL
jgi:iron complex outermembrane receptor protein